MKKIISRIKYWSQIFLLPLYGISFLFPRNKNIWLFGSTFGRRFADNPRYLYMYLNAHNEENIRPIWITHNRDVERTLKAHHLECYYYHSMRGIWYALRGYVYLFDNYSKDICFWLSGGAKKINLWHGTGNKKANHDNEFDRIRHPKNRWEKFTTFLRRISDEKPSHYILATSEPLAIISKSAFNTNNVIIDGYPRNDVILDKGFNNFFTKIEQECLEKIGEWKKSGKYLVLYMPTFRESEEDFFQVMSLEVFNEFLIENNMVFISKLHPKSKLNKRFAEIQCSNIYCIDAQVDPYTFMGQVDMLVTDYSSVYSDFMLLNRPVVGFFYDYKKYTMNTRDSYVSFDEYMPELKATTMKELEECIVEARMNDPCRENRKKSCNRMFLYQDSNASMRLVKKIKEIVNSS